MAFLFVVKFIRTFISNYSVCLTGRGFFASSIKRFDCNCVYKLNAFIFSAAGKAKYADLSEATVQDVAKRWLWSFVNRDGEQSKRRNEEMEKVK